MKHIAIVGFGGAGYSAAKEARMQAPDAAIDVYTDITVGPYNPMLTTYYVKGAIPYDTLFPFGSLEQITRDLRLNVSRGVPVVGLDAPKKQLELADGTRRTYDEILISTGASAFMPPVPGIDLPGVLKMRTVDDAQALKQLVDAGTIKTGLVIGASWVGIKVAEDFFERGIDCTLVDGAGWIFPVAAFQETALRIQRDLEKKRIHLGFSQMLSRIEQTESGQLTAVMENGNRYCADVVVVCIGIRPNVGFLKNSGLKIGRGIQVDTAMRTNFEGIYAAGDCCESPELQSHSHKHVGVWANAQNQGRVAGANMAGGKMVFEENILINLAHYMHMDFLSIGDITTCRPEDEVYEFENDQYYIRGVKQGRDIRCINIYGPAESNGILRSGFVKSLAPGQGFDTRARAALKASGYPNSFINFLGGSNL